MKELLKTLKQRSPPSWIMNASFIHGATPILLRLQRNLNIDTLKVNTFMASVGIT